MSKKMKRTYNLHRYRAKQREIVWNMTFDEWADIWNNSGKYEQRGNYAGQYVMSRINYSQPYDTSNVEIILKEDSWVKLENDFGKPVVIDGVRYKSSNEASEILAIPPSTVRQRIQSESEKFKNWNRE